MARKFLTAIDLAQNELQNARVQNIASAPGSPVKGQLYFDSTTNILYWYSGTAWVPAQGGVVSYGTITAETAFGAAKTDGVATTLARSDHGHGNPTHVNADHAAINISALALATGTVNMNGNNIIQVGDPTLDHHAANKRYVDNAIAGLAWKDSVRAACSVNVPLTGLITQDGVTWVAGDRILIKGQTAPAENGIWVVQLGGWTRASDADAGSELLGAAVYVEEGTTMGDTAWLMTTNAPITVGTTGLTWVQFAGGGTVTAGAGMTQSGNTLNVIAGDTSLTVAADSVIVNTAVIATVASVATKARAFAQALSTSATSYTVNHAFGHTNVIVNVYRLSTPYDTVECDVERPDGNNVTLRFAVAPAANAYQVVVIG